MNEVSKWKKITASGISDDHSRNRINGTVTFPVLIVPDPNGYGKPLHTHYAV